MQNSIMNWKQSSIKGSINTAQIQKAVIGLMLNCIGDEEQKD